MLGFGANILSTLSRPFQRCIRELLDRAIGTFTERADYGAGASVDGPRFTRNNANDIESGRIYGALRKGFVHFSLFSIALV